MSTNEIKAIEAFKRREKLGLLSIFPVQLIREVSKVNNCSYKNLIFLPAGKAQDDILEGISKSLEKLWLDHYHLDECFRIFSLYKKFEPLLYKDLFYRDHFIHQYLVFLTGIPIIYKFHQNIKSYLSKVDSISEDFVDLGKSWLLASTYHDISYPIQRMDDWLKAFFVDFLNFELNPITIDMTSVLMAKDYLDDLLMLSGFSYNIYKKFCPVLDQAYIFKLLVEKLHNRNHGVLSSLILLDKYSECFRERRGDYFRLLLYSQVLPAALAIALHDSNVWEEESISKIIFEEDPITFILMFCDTVQEWGRPIVPASIYQPSHIPLMTNYRIDKDKVTITLTYDIVEEITLKNGERSSTLELKHDEISSLFSKLKSYSIDFEIVLKSTDSDFGVSTYTKSSKSTAS
ncbi:MAG: hypothetical protein AB1345_03340 [Chloroflexota bacterium]